MRYAWCLTDDYAKSLPVLLRPLFRFAMACMRRWDLKSVHRPHAYVAISRAVADRIRRFYGVEVLAVIHPPVRTALFRHLLARRVGRPKSHYLVFGALTSYKRVDLAVRAATRLGRPLVVIGEGPEEKRLRKIAGPNVTFTGWLEDDAVFEILAGARALLFPGEEDFGIVPVEMIAAGIPVIAYGKGGALDTVVHCPEAPARSTGLFFDSQTSEALAAAILEFEAREAFFDPQFMTADAERFNAERFRLEMKSAVDHVLAAAGRPPFFRNENP